MKHPVYLFLRQIAIEVLLFCGYDKRLNTPDRQVLENTLLPHLGGQPDCRTVVFVGCQWYTKNYSRYFPHSTYWTLEPDPGLRRFGSRHHHVCDGLENLERHFQPEALDLIVCNGVFGWGLNDRALVEQAFSACWSRLRPGGLLIVGWNNVPERVPFPLESIQALQGFEPYPFAPLGGVSVLPMETELSHVYQFYRKPDASPAASIEQ